jgi:branched-subunit amino acid transport protein
MTAVEIIILAGMAAVTFGIRAVLLLFAHRFNIPAAWERSLLYVPPAVLTAITVPAVLMPEGSIAFTLGNHYLISGCAALMAGIILRRHALWAAIITGLTVFVLLKLWT